MVIKSKLTTRCIMLVANLVCAVWTFIRCRLRGVNDFDYYVFDLQDEFPDKQSHFEYRKLSPFISKTLIEDTYTQRSSRIRIGDCVIEYSFLKYKRPNFIPEVDLKNLFVSREDRLSKDLAQTLLSHNPDSYKLTKRRKNNVVKLYDF